MNDTGPKTILLVEDETITAMVEKLQLEKAGYNVVHASTGEKAIDIVREKNNKIDLILMDINLGSGIDGTEAAEKILETIDRPLIFLSSHTEAEVVEKTEKITSYGYIVKNSGETVLITSIKMAFRLFDAKLKENEKNEALHESEQRFRNVIEAADEYIFEMDMRGAVTFISDRVKDILGYDPRELIGKTPFDLMASPEEITFLQAVFTELTGRRLPIRDLNHTVLTKDGRKIILSVSAMPFFNTSGEIKGYQGAVKDITERKRSEEALKESEATLRTLINTIPEPALLLDVNMTILATNKAMAQKLGATIEELVNRNALGFLPPDRAASRTAWLNQVVLTGKPSYFEDSRDGNHYINYLNPSFDSSGKVSKIAIFAIDITERKLAEKALAENEKKYRILIEESTDPTFSFTPEGQYTFVNKAFADGVGMTAGDIIGKKIWDVFPKEEADKRFAALNQVFLSGTQKVIEARVPRPGGDQYYLTTINPIKDPEGVTRTVICTSKNITERKLAENAIKLDEARLESILLINQRPAENIQELLDFALNEAIALTESKIGYIYFYDESKKEFTLNTWSREVTHQCTVAEPQTVYQLDKTGIWGEAVRQRRPIVVNDFTATNPLKKGLPEGHAQLTKYLTVPIINQERIVAVAAVANKSDDYNDSDIRQLNLMMDAVWKIVQRKKAEEKIKNLLAEKELILKEVHHRVKNNMNVILGLLMIQADSQDNQETRNILYNAAGRVRSMGVLYDKLYRSENINAISIKKYLPALIDEIANSFPNKASVRIVTQIEEIILDAKILSPIGIIINELITNAMKYAFNGRNDGIISITVSQKKARVLISLEDNGPGMPESASAGFGMQLVEMLIKQINGSFTIERSHGTKFVIEFEAQAS